LRRPPTTAGRLAVQLACPVVLGVACLLACGCTGSVGWPDSGPADEDAGRDGADALDGQDASEGVDDPAAADAGDGDGDPEPVAILFEERFEDADFAARGWYDAPRGDLSTAEHLPGSASSFECFFAQGATGCRGGTPGRRQFPASARVYLSYWVKYSADYVGSGHPYHPHEFHFVTNQDDRWVGPSHTRLTTYTEQVGGVVRVALQDSRNVDLACILRNDDSFVGCGGDFESYPFSEARSACACNGLLGDLDGRDCFPNGDGTWYSARFWDSPERMFDDQPGPRYKGAWHHVECLFALNSIAGGVGVPDGVIQYWYDGQPVLDLHHVLLRTGALPDMAFDQFLIAPYIGDGSPVDQIMWVDDLIVATGRP